MTSGSPPSQPAPTKELITHEEGDPEAWICICGNKPAGEGFYPCDKLGNKVDPVGDWGTLYVCDQCGRIIDSDTLEVVGSNPHFKRAT